MSERVQVVVRIRPFLRSDPPEAELATLVLDDTHVCCTATRVFRVDKVYKMEDETADVYRDSVRPIVEAFLSGYNATVMAYGQTGSGKTYTISGLLPLILEQVVQEGFQGSTEELSFQYIEVYGDRLRDLLSEDPVESAKRLQIHDGSGAGMSPPQSPPLIPSAAPEAAAAVGGGEHHGGSFVLGALRVTASGLGEVMDIVEFGSANRATGSTNVHQHSSRSHSVFTVFNHRRGSKLHVVDLAGSERNKRTLNVGQRFQESIAINGGLLALGNVIRALSRNANQRQGSAASPLPNGNGNGNGNGPAASPLITAAVPSAIPGGAGHIPYRSSKLTRVLQDALGGNGKTLFIACVAPDSLNREETLHSLQYCALAMKVMNTPIKQYNEMYKRQSRSHHVQQQQQQQQQQLLLLGGDASREDGLTFFDRGSGTGKETDLALQTQFDMLQQFCREQEAEIAAMRTRLSDSSQRLQLYEEELSKDKVLFSRQIAEMEKLVSRNKELQGKLAECRRRDRQQQRQYRRLLSTATHDSGRDPHGPHTAASVTRGSVDQALCERSAAPETLKKTLPYLRKTTLRSSGVVASSDSAADEEEVEEEGTERLHAGRTANQSRDEQLLAMAKEALHYQRANARLRRELTAAKVTMEAQQRDAAMLRLELDDLRQILP